MNQTKRIKRTSLSPWLLRRPLLDLDSNLTSLDFETTSFGFGFKPNLPTSLDFLIKRYEETETRRMNLHSSLDLEMIPFLFEFEPNFHTSLGFMTHLSKLEEMKQTKQDK